MLYTRWHNEFIKNNWAGPVELREWERRVWSHYPPPTTDGHSLYFLFNFPHPLTLSLPSARTTTLIFHPISPYSHSRWHVHNSFTFISNPLNDTAPPTIPKSKASTQWREIRQTKRTIASTWLNKTIENTTRTASPPPHPQHADDPQHSMSNLGYDTVSTSTRGTLCLLLL